MSTVLFNIENQIGYITLNRPEKRNAFNKEMALELQAILERCETDAHVRCVYISGAGTAFSAGQDLHELVEPGHPKMNRIVSEHYNPIVMKIKFMAKPVVAAVNGVAAGAGANIALCCDVVVAAQSASFIQAFCNLGLIPDSGGTFTLPRLVGWQKASALMMLGDKVGSEDAERMGMIYKWFADDQFEAEAKKIALQLATAPTKALAYTKQALRWSTSHVVINEQLENEDKLQQRAATTADYKEGVKAFIEKRPPVFKGE